MDQGVLRTVPVPFPSRTHLVGLQECPLPLGEHESFGGQSRPEASGSDWHCSPERMGLQKLGSQSVLKLNSHCLLSKVRLFSRKRDFLKVSNIPDQVLQGL